MAKGIRQRRLTPFSGCEFIRRTYARGLLKAVAARVSDLRLMSLAS